MPLENPLTFYPCYFGDLIVSSARIAALFAKVHLMVRRIERDPNSKTYTDEALRLTDDYEHQEMYQLSEAARQAGVKAKRVEERHHSAAAARADAAE